jgi:hypothetical protein
MTDLKIEFDQNRQTFEPGEDLAGEVSWSLDKPVNALELRLFWFTRGKGTEDAGVVQTMKFEGPQSQETRPFQFRLPDAPYSFSGQLISLVWALELIVYPSKDMSRREFIMGPDGKEVRVESVPSTGLAQVWISTKC